VAADLERIESAAGARRRFVRNALGLGVAALLPQRVRGAPAPIRIGTTAVILDD
jgi:hypothetical protein